MTANLLLIFKQKLAGLTLVPSSGGCFEVTVGGTLIYSKLATHAFPDEATIVAAVRAKLAAP